MALTKVSYAMIQGDPINVLDFGADPTGTNDNAAAFTAAIAASIGKTLYIPAGTYKTSLPLEINATQAVMGDYEATRIRLSAAASYVMRVGKSSGNLHLAEVSNLILDGNGFSADGLYLQSAISCVFNNIRVTNVTANGLHLAYGQLCTFNNYVCSDNVESFTTTPVTGILTDTATSSANTFINTTVERVSGVGIKLLASISTTFIGGTSEGNDIGIQVGETSAGTLTASNNMFSTMDLEVNTTTDILLEARGGRSTFNCIAAGFNSPAVQIKASSASNTFIGGTTAGFTIDSGALYNNILGTSLRGAGATITSVFANQNYWKNVRNVTTGAKFADSVEIYINNTSYLLNTSGGTATINCNTADYITVYIGNGVATIANPTNAVDGKSIDINIWHSNAGGGSVVWGAAFVTDGWTTPAANKNRSVRFRYNSNIGKWYPVAMSQVDQTN